MIPPGGGQGNSPPIPETDENTFPHPQDDVSTTFIIQPTSVTEVDANRRTLAMSPRKAANVLGAAVTEVDTLRRRENIDVEKHETRCKEIGDVADMLIGRLPLNSTLLSKFGLLEAAQGGNALTEGEANAITTDIMIQINSVRGRTVAAERRIAMHSSTTALMQRQLHLQQGLLSSSESPAQSSIHGLTEKTRQLKIRTYEHLASRGIRVQPPQGYQIDPEQRWPGGSAVAESMVSEPEQSPQAASFSQEHLDQVRAQGGDGAVRMMQMLAPHLTERGFTHDQIGLRRKPAKTKRTGSASADVAAHA